MFPKRESSDRIISDQNLEKKPEIKNVFLQLQKEQPPVKVIS